MRFFRERKISKISENPQKCSVFNETQDLSFFCRGDFNRGVVLPIFTFVCLFVKLAAGPFWQSSACFSLFTTFQLPKWPGIDFPTFPWSFPARSGYLWTKIDRNRRFGCNLTRFSLIAYTSLSNPSLPFSRQTNDIFCKFFLNFQGLIQPPLLSWQKAGRIWLGFAGNPSSFPTSPLFACISVKFFPSPSP